jgi:hypothetical protein
VIGGKIDNIQRRQGNSYASNVRVSVSIRRKSRPSRNIMGENIVSKPIVT